MNYDETITTLQFASRAIKIKVNAHINEKIEMKRMKDKLNDYSKLKNMDQILLNNHRLEKEGKELKSNMNGLRNDYKGGKNSYRSKSNNRDNDDESNYRTLNNNRHDNSNSNQGDSLEIQEYTSIAKKFHSIILHLQTELSKATVTIINLSEENKMLKEKISKSQS